MSMSLNPSTGFIHDMECPHCGSRAMAKSDECSDCGEKVENWERAEIFQLQESDRIKWTSHEDKPEVEIREHVNDIDRRQEIEEEEDGYIGEVVETGTTVYIPYSNLDEFEVVA